MSIKTGKSYHQILTLQIENAGVENNLNRSKASGPDEMPPRLLKTMAHEFPPALTFLFQESYYTKIVPTQWKQALVAAIYKKKKVLNQILQITTIQFPSPVFVAKFWSMLS